MLVRLDGLDDEPVLRHRLTLEDLRFQIKPDHAEADDQLLRLSDAAFQRMENDTLTCIHQRALTALYRGDPPTFLPRPPLIENSVSVLHEGQALPVTQVGDAIFPEDDWPDGTIQITYRAGRASVPEDMKAAALMLCRHLYDNRSAVAEVQHFNVPEGYRRIMKPYLRGPRV